MSHMDREDVPREGLLGAQINESVGTSQILCVFRHVSSHSPTIPRRSVQVRVCQVYITCIYVLRNQPQPFAEPLL